MSYIERVLHSSLEKFAVVRDGRLLVPSGSLHLFQLDVSGMATKKLSRRQMEAIAEPIDGFAEPIALLHVLRAKGVLVQDTAWHAAVGAVLAARDIHSDVPIAAAASVEIDVSAHARDSDVPIVAVASAEMISAHARDSDVPISAAVASAETDVSALAKDSDVPIVAAAVASAETEVPAIARDSDATIAPVVSHVVDEPVEA